MDTQTEAATPRKARGRKDSDGQEAVIKLESLNVRVDDLVAQKLRLDHAKAEYKDSIEATAKAAGLEPAIVNKFITAKAGDDFEKTKTKALQLALVFSEAE